MELSTISTRELKKTIARLENRLDKTTANYDKAQATYNELQKLEAELELRQNKHNGFSFR